MAPWPEMRLTEWMASRALDYWSGLFCFAAFPVLAEGGFICLVRYGDLLGLESIKHLLPFANFHRAWSLYDSW